MPSQKKIARTLRAQLVGRPWLKQEVLRLRAENRQLKAVLNEARKFIYANSAGGRPFASGRRRLSGGPFGWQTFGERAATPRIFAGGGPGKRPWLKALRRSA
jgi:hypothetical protein